MESTNLSFIEKLRDAHILLRDALKDDDFKKLNLKMQDLLETLHINLFAYICAIQLGNDVIEEAAND